MLRPSAAAIPAALLLLGALGAPARSSIADDPPLSRAKALLDRDDALAAVPILEDALIAAEPADRPALIDTLKSAYAKAATQAEAAGQTLQAETYRQNLAILEHTAVPPASAPESATEPAPDAEAPAPLPHPEEGGLDPEVRSASLPEPSEPKPSAPAAGPKEEPPAEAPEPEPDPALNALARANKAFQARQYLDAGALYAQLARDGKLPPEYRDAWAYCRRFVVVRRINAGPRTSADWSAIAGEIAQIRRLTPDHWYDEYLLNLVRERSAHAPRSDGRKVVLRGASPDERTPARAQSPAPTRAPAPGGPAPGSIAPASDPPTAPAESPKTPADPFGPEVAPKPAPAAPEPEVAAEAPAPALDVPPPASPFTSPELANWQVHDSANFRIYHADPELARKVARVAETTREAQARKWTGAPPQGRWSPVCEIYLYPNGRIFSQQTQQPPDSPGFSTSGLMSGRVTARRINLRADHAKLLPAVLPHEVTHIVLAELFPTRQIPRWADEGMAVLAEPVEEQRSRDGDLATPLNGGKIFSVEQILTMQDYPDGQHWPLYYAQSISLTRFLVEQSTPARFVQFVRDSQQIGEMAALQKHYQFKDYVDLQSKWLTYARRPADGEVRTASNPRQTQ